MNDHLILILYWIINIVKYTEKAVSDMIEKNDWRLTAGPILGSKEKFKNIPLLE